LFTLNDASLVQTKLSFPAAEPGLVVAYLDDTAGPDADPARKGVVVIINPFPQEKTVTLPATRWSPHPLSTDAQRTHLTNGAATVPPRSVVVLVR
jgi:pullulanase/glycogen debranching enzyme